MAAVAPKCTELHRYPELPEDLQSLVCSYNSHPVQFLVTSKGARKTVDTALERWSYPQIQAAPQGSLIGRLTSRHPFVNTKEGRIELVKRVRNAAIETLRQGELLDSDYEELGIEDVADLSFRGMNEADERIKRNREDRILVDAFSKILENYPPLAASIDLPENEDALHETAERIRGWMDDMNPDLQALRDSVLEIETHELRGIPPELLRFPNLSLRELLHCAEKNHQTDIVRAILNDPRPIDYHDLFNLFVNAHRLEYQPEMVALFLRSNRDIDQRDLPIIFLKAIDHDASGVIENLLTGGREITPGDLGLALGTSAHLKKWDIARAILRSERPFAQVLTGIDSAIEDRQWEIAEALFAHGNFFPVPLGRALLIAFNMGKKSWVRRILDRNEEIYPEVLGYLLRKAVDHSSLVDYILNSPRPIDPEHFGKALCEALERGDRVRARRLIQSNRKISALGFLALAIALKKGYLDLAREMQYLPMVPLSNKTLAIAGIAAAGTALLLPKLLRGAWIR